VTLFLEEDKFGTLGLYTDMAQVMVNRYQLQYSNPSLDGKLGLPTGSFSSIVQATSQVWNNGNLTTKQDTTLTNMMNSQQGSTQCTMFDSALVAAQEAMAAISSPGSMMPGVTAGISANTLWFYIPNSNPHPATGNPVKTQFWAITDLTYQANSFKLGSWTTADRR
jgi:hypothetical protein